VVPLDPTTSTDTPVLVDDDLVVNLPEKANYTSQQPLPVDHISPLSPVVVQLPKSSTLDRESTSTALDAPDPRQHSAVNTLPGATACLPNSVEPQQATRDRLPETVQFLFSAVK
jgi:hypothetical protein